MEWEIIKQVLELGSVTVLAILVFLMYRRDRLSTEKRDKELLKADQDTRAKHTQVLAELITWLKMKNGNK